MSEHSWRWLSNGQHRSGRHSGSKDAVVDGTFSDEIVGEQASPVGPIMNVFADRHR
jgi:hypothetical protein